VTDIELVSHAHAPVKLHGLLANEAAVLTPPAFSIFTSPNRFSLAHPTCFSDRP
jgi:hypothetical protein